MFQILLSARTEEYDDDYVQVALTPQMKELLLM